MASIDSIRREYERYPPNGLRRFTRWFTKRIPTRLYARALLIIIIPMVCCSR
jgi:two-component system osmolarity sensor histidine kinase EnvZ